MENRPAFEKLAIMFEGSTASSLERAYRKAVDKLTELLVTECVLHAVRLKQKSKTMRKKKIAATVYEYRPDCDCEWGKISLGLENNTVEIVRPADWGTVISCIFPKRVIAYLPNCEIEKLQKEKMIVFEQ